MPQPEGKLYRRIKAYLEGRGAFVVKIHGGDNVFQEAGLPDLFVCYKGYFIGLEVKTDVGKPSPRQLAVLRRIERAGGVGEVVTSVEQVERILTKLDRKR
jgi:hypothetical protein